MSKRCGICNSELGFWDRKTRLQDGYVCKACLDQGALKMSWDLSNSSIQYIQALIEKRSYAVNSFAVTKKVHDRMKIDEKNKAFKIKDTAMQEDMFLYSDLLKYELVEDGLPLMYNSVDGSASQMIKNANGTTVIDTLDKVLTKYVGVKKTLELKIYLANVMVDTKTIRFTSGEERLSKEEYVKCLDKARNYASALDVIINEMGELQSKHTIAVNNTNNILINATQINAKENGNVQDSIVIADVLLKYKNLLDSGVITETEFEEQKKVLFGRTYCKHCGNSIEKTDKFCSRCGKPIC